MRRRRCATARFRQFICDRTLAGLPAESAAVYDIGGTGQLSARMDRQGRIRIASDVNPNPFSRASLNDISQIEDGSADLLIICRTLGYFRDADAERFLSRVRSALSPSGVLALCDPELPAPLRRLYGWTGRAVAGRPLHFRTAAQTSAMVRQAGFRQSTTENWGRHFVIFARL